VIAEAANALLRPRIAMSGRDADAIEQAWLQLEDAAFRGTRLCRYCPA
jgi:hypothetical protein